MKDNKRLQELEQENWRLEDLVEELEDEVSSLKAHLKTALSRINEHAQDSEEKQELLELVNEALGDVYGEDFEALGAAVRALIDEYSDAVEEAEDLA